MDFYRNYTSNKKNWFNFFEKQHQTWHKYSLVSGAWSDLFWSTLYQRFFRIVYKNLFEGMSDVILPIPMYSAESEATKHLIVRLSNASLFFKVIRFWWWYWACIFLRLSSLRSFHYLWDVLETLFLFVQMLDQRTRNKQLD